jgi:hypothetical protein
MKLFKYNQFINESSDYSKYSNRVDYIIINSNCSKYGIEDYVINGDGSIDINENVGYLGEWLGKLPIKIRNVSGYFYCEYSKLKSLKGSPISVGGYFSCDNNELTSLEGSPKEIGDDFYCSNNQLTSLEGISQRISGDIYCHNNKLRDVRGIKEGWRGNLDIEKNPVHSIFKLFPYSRFDEVVEYLNEYDVIRDGKVVVLQALEQVYYEMDLDYPEIEYIKGYEII